jgi:hypothetical protein
MANPVGPLVARLNMLSVSVSVVTVAASGVGAWLGAWWVPFVVGVAVGFLRVTSSGFWRGTTTAAVIGAIIGWLLPVWVLALRGQPVGATARAIAALAGLPPYAGVTIAVLVLLAALQVWVGAWLARAVSPKDMPGKRSTAATPAEPQT